MSFARRFLPIDASTGGAVFDREGTPSEVLFTLGPPLRGLALSEIVTARMRRG
ncbi:MAG TPA: hypothetical protein VMA95_20035 [Streptosporangiaceae bacterium]|nr:hypothetical protein [Streptosporangiaceae bacterium]